MIKKYNRGFNLMSILTRMSDFARNNSASPSRNYLALTDNYKLLESYNAYSLSFQKAPERIKSELGKNSNLFSFITAYSLASYIILQITASGNNKDNTFKRGLSKGIYNVALIIFNSYSKNKIAGLKIECFGR
jgi:hypothetical protein